MMLLSQAATLLNGELHGSDGMFTAVSKDSRSIARGDLYVAIRGERFDGHDFVGQAFAGGAAGALVSRLQPTQKPQLCVADTRLALGGLAAGWRRQFKGGIAAITGSNGKTTVKEMCRSIFAQHAGAEHVLSTEGNLNNDIGMPLTLLKLRAQHRYGVIEMGANHGGEIDYLTRIAHPDVALITNVGPAHVGEFGSVDNIAKAKAEIYHGLTQNGTAIINADDRYADDWRQQCRDKKIMTFSKSDDSADVYAADIADNRFMLCTQKGDREVGLRVAGEHNIMNALAAAAVAVAFDVPLGTITQGLNNFTGVPGRLSVTQSVTGVTVIDDSYNANPFSLQAAIRVLVVMQGEPWLVLGDMGELGEQSRQLHHEAGVFARQQGVKRLFATGDDSRYAVEGFGEGAQFFADRRTLVREIIKTINSNVVVLVKGSRFMAMEQVVQALLNNDVSMGTDECY